MEKLKEAGIKTAVLTSMKKLKLANEVHIAAVLRDGESYSRSNSKKIFVDQDGIEKRRIKLFQKTTKLKVIIGESTEEKCEEIFEKFIKLLGKGTDDGNGNWIDMELKDADWVESDDSILKSKIAVECIIECMSGVYVDKVLIRKESGNVFLERK